MSKVREERPAGQRQREGGPGPEGRAHAQLEGRGASGRSALSPPPQPLGKVSVEVEGDATRGAEGDLPGGVAPRAGAAEASKIGAGPSAQQAQGLPEGAQAAPGNTPGGGNALPGPRALGPLPGLEMPADIELHDRAADGMHDTLERMHSSLQDMRAKEDALTERLTAMRDALRKAEKEGEALRARLDSVAPPAGSAAE